MSNPIELYNVFDKGNHLQPEFDKAVFEVLHSWDFGWAILEPINIASDRSNDKLLSHRFSPGQKHFTSFGIWMHRSPMAD